jgi:hypothetical protein
VFVVSLGFFLGLLLLLVTATLLLSGG